VGFARGGSPPGAGRGIHWTGGRLIAMSPPPAALAERLRLIVITDGSLAAPRSVIEVVAAALAAGAPAVQLRDKHASAAELLDLAQALRALTRSTRTLLFVNDRLDVALAAGADGVHLGPDDLPVGAVRRCAPPGFLIGFSTDDADGARRAVREGADYIGCGAVYLNRVRRSYPLQADPTVLYALGGYRARLLFAAIDSVADNPYNTYAHPGLPPGPIGAPGELALNAVLEPADVDFMYFGARPDASHTFTRTLSEHNRAVALARRAWDSLAAVPRPAPGAASTGPAGG
jgi:thiamine-phosphate diphosphorylase